MTEQLTRVMVPAEHVLVLNDLGKTALFNVAPELKSVDPDMVVDVAGLWRCRTQYRFELRLSSAIIEDSVSLLVDKDQIESHTLTLLESFPYVKW